MFHGTLWACCAHQGFLQCLRTMGFIHRSALWRVTWDPAVAHHSLLAWEEQTLNKGHTAEGWTGRGHECTRVQINLYFPNKLIVLSNATLNLDTHSICPCHCEDMDSTVWEKKMPPNDRTQTKPEELSPHHYFTWSEWGSSLQTTAACDKCSIYGFDQGQNFILRFLFMKWRDVALLFTSSTVWNSLRCWMSSRCGMSGSQLLPPSKLWWNNYCTRSVRNDWTFSPHIAL